MIKTLQRHSPTISTLLLITLLVILFFSPASSQALSMVVLIFGIGIAIVFIAHDNWQKHKEGEITRSKFFRNTILDLLGLALIMGAAMWLGRLAGGYAGQAVGIKAGQGWGMAAGIAAGMIAGFGAALFVGKFWGKIAEPLKSA